ncbi:hypothetical protein [Arenibaculum pallidiluteum]|uniref:hypothetical protein n=1 Tax=Arenibaculum pallidiluteum TaxID=2812559 RepID=UPI001A9794BA|nr:hypothetical protein [Arenibaculum pallidiluteum]
MSIEMRTVTVTLAAADPSGCGSAVEHRARIWGAVADLARAVRSAGMAGEARLRAQDIAGRVRFEATRAGAAFLAGLPGVVEVIPRT